jgi:hypothetical protein
MRACRLVAGKSTLAARVDFTRGDHTAKTGINLREEIRKKIEKWQEPPPPKQPKPLPVPDSDPKKKRGGRRLRKMKERWVLLCFLHHCLWILIVYFCVQKCHQGGSSAVCPHLLFLGYDHGPAVVNLQFGCLLLDRVEDLQFRVL